MQAVQIASPSGVSMYFTCDWRVFERTIVRARTLIVHMPSGDRDHELSHAVQSLPTRYPFRPLVILTSRNPNSLRSLVLSGVAAVDLIWADSIEHDLWPALNRATSRGLVGRLASLIETADISPRSFRAALAAAIRSPIPPRRVTDLATLANCDRATLWKHWHATFGRHSRLQPSDFVHWLILLEAADRKRGGQPWSAIADEFRVHERTLSRLVGRYTGLHMRQLEQGGDREIIARFETDVLQQLLSRDVRECSQDTRTRRAFQRG